MLMQVEGYIFDGLLGQTGGGKAMLYHVIDAQKPLVFCGKVYCIDTENDQTISVEIHSSKLLHQECIHPHIVHYMDTKPFFHSTAPSKSMVVLIMPLYELSLTSLLEALLGTSMSLKMFQTLTNALLSACSRFEELDKCHCDVKPENIMISKGTFILIDLGAVTDVNQPLREFTEGYYLDASIHCANSTFDLNCIAVTLGRCCIKDFEAKRGRTRAMYLEMLDKQEIHPQYKNAIRICLTSTRCKDAQESIRRLFDA
jgi:serine/threonine protein kinase